MSQFEIRAWIALDSLIQTLTALTADSARSMPVNPLFFYDAV